MRVLLLMAMLLLFGCEKADNHPVKATPPTDGFHVYKASALGNLPIGSTLSFDIDEPLTVSTITPTSLLLEQIEEDANRTLAYSFTYENKRLSIKPDKPLLGGSTCRITFTPAIKSTRGFGLKEALSFEFSVQTSGDTAIPQLLRIEPQASERLYTNSRFFVHFSKPLLDYDIDACFVLEDNATGEQVPATYTLFYNTVMITPDEPLKTTTTYQVRYDHPVFALNGLESNSSANVTRYYTSSPIAMPEIEAGVVIIDANQSQLRNPTVLEVSSFSPTALPQTPGDISVTLAPSLNQQENAVVYVGGNGGLERWEVASDGVTFASMRHYDYAHEVVSLLSVAQNRVLIGHTSGMDLVEFNDGTLSIKDSIALDTPAYALDGNGTHIAVALLSKGHALYSLANDKLELVRMMAPNSEVNSTTGIDLSGSDANMITDVAFTSYETTRYLTTCSYLNGVTQYELNGTKVSSSRVDGTACLKLKASGNYLNVIKGASGVSRYLMTGVTPNAFTDEFTVRTFSADALGLSYPYDAFIADRFGGAVLYEYGAGKRLAQNIQALRIEALTSNKKFALILERSGALKIINTQPDVISPSVSSVKAEGGNSEVSSVVVSFSEDIKATNFAEFITLTSGSGSVSYSVNVISSSEVNLTLSTPLDISNAELNISITGLQDDYGNTMNPYSAMVDVSALKTVSIKAPKLVFLPSQPYGKEPWLLNLQEGSTEIANLVKDINPRTENAYPGAYIQMGATLYFSADDGLHGKELWKSDGTAAGTVMVKEINVNGSSNPGQIINVNGTLFFSATDENGTELWKSDGTAAGTVMVKDISPNSSSYPTNLINFNGTLYFTASDGTNGNELWRSDGTAGGTQLVLDINPGALDALPSNLTLYNNRLFFTANDGTNGMELWQTDGVSTPSMVVDIYSAGSANPSLLTVSNGVLYFSANDGINGNELWQSDGTAGATRLLKDINSGAGNTFIFEMVDANGTLFFSARDANGTELWKSDGTAAGTVMVKDIYAGVSSSNPDELTYMNGNIYFSATDASGTELWRSDGTAVGTVAIDEGVSNSAPLLLSAIGNTLYFSASDGNGSSVLWQSDGTNSGTIPISSVSVGDIGDGTAIIYPFNTQIFFTGVDSATGYELYSSNGVSASLFKDINTKTSASVQNEGIANESNGTYYFVADDGVYGTELWKSDGSEAGTVMVKDIGVGSSGSGVSNITPFQGKIYFSANDGVNGYELWQSDGTAAGTQLVQDIATGSISSFPSNLTVVDSRLFFTARESLVGTELFSYDGTTLGLVNDLAPATASSSPSNLTAVNGTLFFTAFESTFGSELYISNGTDGNTTLVKDIQVGSTSSYPSYLTAFNGKLYFSANDGIDGNELWVSDGTVTGTKMVKNINTTIINADLNPPTTSGSNPTNFTVMGNVLFFSATDANGTELWKSDGTAAGTKMVKDITVGATSSYPSHLVAVNNLLFFTIGDFSNGYSLWRSDGTASGTFELSDLNNTVLDGSYDESFFMGGVNNLLYFTRPYAPNGVELWRSDGTVAGTKLYKSEL